MSAGLPRGLLLAALALLSVPEGAATGKPRVEVLEARIDGERVLASFRALDCWSPEMIERVQSGIPVTFKYRVAVLSGSSFLGLAAKELARTKIETQAAYNSLTGRYQLERSVRVRTRAKRDAPAVQVTSHSTGSLTDVRAWMTVFRDIPIYDPSRPLAGRQLRVRVESNLGRRYVLWIFPATVNPSGEMRLEG